MQDLDFDQFTADDGDACGGDCSACSSCSSDCGHSGLTPRYAKKIIAVLSGKGGTGKSMVTALLAGALQSRGLKVGILDADIAGPTQHLLYGLEGFADSDDKKIFPMTTANGVKVISMGNVYDKPESPILWGGKELAGGAQYFYTEVSWDDTDVILVDMPTGLGDIPMQMYTVVPFDACVLVCTPDSLCDYTAVKSINLCKMVRVPPLGVIENKVAMTCHKCGEAFTLGTDPKAHADKLGLPLVSALEYDVELAILAEMGRIAEAKAPALDQFADTLEQMVRDSGAQ